MSEPRTRDTAFRYFIECVRADIATFAQHEGRPVTLGLTLRMIFLVPGFQFVLSRRVQDLLYTIPVVGRTLGRLCWWWTCRSFGSEIAIVSPIGKGFYVPHPYGIVIGLCEVGENVTILQNVTIGVRSLTIPGGATICDGVLLSAGSVVLGTVVIGRNAVVGANSVVTKDVPEGAIAVGAPARLIGASRPTITNDVLLQSGSV